MRTDQNIIFERGGGPIEDYLPHALSIIYLNEIRFTRLRKQLILGWVKAAAEAAFTADPDSFELLSQQELELIWREV